MTAGPFTVVRGTMDSRLVPNVFPVASASAGGDTQQMSMKRTDATDEVARHLMEMALHRLRSDLHSDGCYLPPGRSDVVLGDIRVVVYGLSPVSATVTVQCVIDGRGYSCDIGPRSGKLGKMSYFKP